MGFRHQSKGFGLIHSALGLSFKVLRVQWPEGSEPLKSANFETAARKLRYQALGRACSQEGINALLFAHHADDQAETVLMRLSWGDKGLGLQGIRSVGVLPECFGIYGAHQSGSPHRDVEPEPRKTRGSKSKGDAQMLDYEGGGVMVYRPLLEFSKERLVATCLESDTQWFEDRTNKDISLTPRNAIRHLLQSDRLPKALRKASLLNMSETMRQYDLKRKETVNWLLGRCEFLMFDTRSGSLVVRLPKKTPTDREKSTEVDRDITRAETWSIVGRLASSIARLVTSLEVISTMSLNAVIGLLSPDVAVPENGNPPGPTSRGTELRVYRATGGNADFRRAYWPLTYKPPELSPDAIENLDPEYVWIVTRSMYRNADCPTITIPDISNGAPRHTEDPSVNINGTAYSPNSPKESEGNSEWSPWHLWDGRFWIRVMNKTGFPVTIRPLKKTDMEPFRLSLQRKQRRQLDHLLALVAPDHVRFTLPAILGHEDDQILALPSLQLVRERESNGKRLSWQIRYKMVDLDIIK